MVHWLGEGTDVIICLAREPPLGILDDPKKLPAPSPSSVFLSYDYGDTFQDKSDLFNITINGTSIRSTVDEFITHLKFNTIVFTDARNKAIFSSADYGRTFQSSLLDFKPSDVTFYEQDARTFLALDKEDPERKLYYTTDLGKSFNLLQSRVKSFVWSSIEGYPVHLYVERTEPTNTSSIIFLDAANLLKPGNKNKKFNLLIENVQEFFIKKDFMFATQKILEDTKVLISYRRGRFVKATFQTELDIKGIHVADVDGKRILLSVMHTEKISHLYVSESNADMSEIKFVPSLENIFSYLPNQNWRSSWLVQTSDEAFTDLYKVEGLQGIYIASKIQKMPTSELISPDHLGSVITFDHGSTWRAIHAPTVDDEGIKIQNCKDCSLHLSQKFSQLYPVTRSVSIMSSKSAPGVIMASGVIGKSLKGHPGVFISRDAGLTWKQILKNYYFFNMGDHGGVLVAVKYFKSKGETNEILYSTDEGETWIPHPFHANDLKVYGLMTEPNTNTTMFTLFGSEVSEHKWLIIKIDLKNAFSANCTEDDYKFWAPGLYSDGSLMPCLLGQRLTYQRRKPHAQCHNGLNYERPYKTEICGCNKWDFECDYGFTRPSSSSHCVRNKTIPNFDPFEPPKTCKPGRFYNRTKGYRKIEGDVCIDGFANPYLPQEIPCPIKFDKEFLIVAQRDKISSIDLSTNSAEILPIKGVKNVIAIDFDRKHNCVFWADILSDTIGRQCLNGNESAEILVETGLGSVEGMSYDWTSELLYYVDGLRLRIEAVYVGNTTTHGRFRKTIVNNLAKPRGIVVHPIQECSLKYLISDGTDEICDNKTSVTCKPDEFRCNSTGSCIPEQWRCDLDNDCQDGSDELHCRNKTCDAWMFRCGDGLCIYKTWQCDGENDCADQSDEKNCSNLNPSKSSNKTPPGYLPDDTCHDWMFKCSNQKCIPYWWKCDTVNDCGDNSDEIGCDTNSTTPTTNSVTTTTEKSSINRPKCRPNEFACDSGNCIAMRYVCDNYTDCAHGEDEIACPQNQQCSPGEFRCLSDGLCLPLSKYCDKIIHCADGSDENCQFPVYPAKSNNCENNPGMFICDDTCLPLMKKCDGKVDCIISGEDEDKQMCSKFQRVYQVIQIGVDERTLNATSFLIYWWIPVPANITFEYMPSIYVKGQWQNNTNWIETATDFRFTKLMPYTVYNVTVYVRIKGSKTVFPPHLFYEVATSEGIPTPPLNVSVQQINGSRVQVSWVPPKNINGHLEDYFIFYRAQVAKTSNAASIRVGALENSTIIESEFKDGVVYEFWVKVKNRRFSSAPSEHVTLKFDGTANIDAITNLKIVSQKEDSITLTWDNIKRAEGYIIQPILPQPYPRIEPFKTKDTKIQIEKLVPGVQYVLKVSGYIKQYVGRPATLIFTVPKSEPLPVVKNVNVTKIGDIIKVSWDKVTHTKYTNFVYGIYYGPNLDELAERPRLKTTNTNIEIKDMKPCESYMISVNIIEPYGPGPLSDPKTIATGFKLTEPPRNLQVDIKGQNMIITWEPSCPLLTNANLVEYMITIREHILNKTNHVTVQPTPNRTLVHNFAGIPKGSHYTVTVAINTDKAKPAVAEVSADPLPAPTQLRVWPEKNGSYSVHWKELDFHDEKHKYEAVVFEGMGINGTEIAVIEAKNAPVQIHQSHLGGSKAAGKVFTVGVRMRTERGFISGIDNIEYISVQPDGLHPDNYKQSGFSWWWLILGGILIASLISTVVFLVQRQRRLQSSFSRFVNGHYDTKTGATRFFEDDHHETATTFADDEPLVVT
uniref:Sortilin-related receptor n=1 Tax=Culicoides sonorensis TaxID=179676 RepID=A0A336L6F8_CULSO